MKEGSPSKPADGTSPTDTNGLSDAAASGRGDGVVAVASNRPTPSPPSTAATASSNAGVETTTDECKVTVEIIAKDPSQEESKNIVGSCLPASSTAATPLPSSSSSIRKKNVATASTSMKQSPLEGAAICHQTMKFTPIRSAYSLAPRSISRGYGNSILATPGPVTSRMDTMPLLESSAGSAAMMHGNGHDDFSITRGVGIGMTPLPPLDEVNFDNVYSSNQDEYALPPFFQSHLDETFAASSSPNALFLPSILSSSTGNNHEAETMLPFASYVPNIPNEAANAEYQLSAFAGVAPPDPTGRRVAVNNGNVHTGSSSMAPLVREKVITCPTIPSKTSFFDTTTSTKIRTSATRGPQLPLRKRPFREEEERIETKSKQSKQEGKAVKKSTRPKGPSTKKPSVKKSKMVRHNYNENRTSCKCAKSRCLKLYCDCFQSGRMCDPNECECKSCLNLEKYNGRNGARTKAIKECLAKNPNAFKKRQKGSDEGCGCKKNRCLKKYCVCFNAGVLCDESCRCQNCGNREVKEEVVVGNDEVAEDAELKVKASSEDVVEEPPTTYVKVTSLSDNVDNTSPITESSSDSLAHSLPQRHENANQVHSIIYGEYLCGRDQCVFESYAEV